MPETGSRSTGQKVVHNTAAIISGDFFYYAINFCAGISIARSLGEARYGEWSFIYVFLSLFEMFIRFGLDTILTRQLSQHKEEAGKIIGNAIYLRVALTLISLPVIYLTAHLLRYPISTQQGLMFASVQLFLSVRGFFDAIFRVELESLRVAFWNGVRGLINLVFVAAIFWIHPSMFLYIAAAALSGFVAFAGLVLNSRRLVRVQFTPDFGLMKYLARESFPLVLSGYLTLLYYRIDVFMLSKMQGFESVGLYSVATRISEALNVIATSLLASLFPVLANAWKSDRDEFKRLFGKTLEVLLAVGLPLAIGGLFTSTDLIELLFGARYQASGVTLSILLWFTCFGFVSILLVNVLIICGKQIMDTWISFGLVVANITMNAFLIPHFGYNGAALATVLVEVFGGIAMAVYLMRTGIVDPSLLWARLLRVLLVNACFAAFLFVLNGFHLPVFFFILAGSFFYVGLIFIFRILKPADLRYYLAYGRQK